MIIIKIWMYKLPHELPNDLRSYEISSLKSFRSDDKPPAKSHSNAKSQQLCWKDAKNILQNIVRITYFT